MPKKFDSTGASVNSSIFDTSPIIEKIKDTEKLDAVSEMMSTIIEDRQKVKNSTIMDMTGVLTPVLYYQLIPDETNNYAIDANGPSDIAINSLRYNKIKDFKVKLTGATNLENDGDEQDKSYITNGSLIILPRSIMPNENDMFIMEYYGKKIAYIISSVNTETFEDGSGYKCEYTLYKQDYEPLPRQIVKTYKYIQEFVSTTYRTVLLEEEYENIKNFEKLYSHLSSVYNSLFYDRDINGYIFKDYDFEKHQINIKDNNNINTLGIHGGLYRGNKDGHMVCLDTPIKVRHYHHAYDNFITNFMEKNRIFRDYDGLLLSVEPLLELDRVSYKRSVYGCLESRSVANYKNTFVSPINIDYYQPGLSSYFVGKKNVIYSDHTMCHDPDFGGDPKFPESLINQLKGGKNVDMSLGTNDTVYGSIDDMIIETIVRFVYKKTDDFIDRFKYLYDNIDNLYEHEISYANIFYLFPMLGYIIEKSLEEIYKA